MKKKNKKKVVSYFLFAFNFLILFFISGSTYAADHFIRQNASGRNDGSDWINAWQVIPQSLVRGDTYYIADGVYPSYIFDDSVQNTQYITIKKANQIDHGTELGWQDNYGDGQSEFNSTLTINTSYLVLDGKTGGGPENWKDNYGFVVKPTSCANQIKGIRLNNSPKFIEIKHIEFSFCGDQNTSNDVIYGNTDVSDFIISNCFIHDVSRTAFLMRNWNNITIEYNYIKNLFNSYGIHQEAISDIGSKNVKIRYNIWEDVKGTGILVFGGTNNYEIYGNLFFHNPEFAGSISNGSIATWSGEYMSNANIYNNTFSGLKGLSSGINFDPDAGSIGNTAYNNIWDNCAQVVHRGTLIDYNSYNETPFSWNNIASPHDQITNNKIFIDPENNDYRLSQATDPGIFLPEPFDSDILGNLRGKDGIWDRGSYEFDSAIQSDIIPPTLPIGLIVE